VPDSLEAGLRVLLIRGNAVAQGLHVEAERHESLLYPIVEVALDPAPCLVAGGDDSCTGGDQRVSALRIRDRGREQLGELHDSRLRVGR
jgi:hypothetical protein